MPDVMASEKYRIGLLLLKLEALVKLEVARKLDVSNDRNMIENTVMCCDMTTTSNLQNDFRTATDGQAESAPENQEIN